MNKDLSSKLDVLLKRGIEDGIFPGAVALVTLKGKVQYQASFGSSMIRPEKKAIQYDSIFDLASLTKVVATTTAALQLIEGGSLSLSDKVSSFFSEFSWDEGNTKANVEDLMAHTSGFPAHYPFWTSGQSPREAVRVIASFHPSLQMMYEPGTSEMYSDIDYILLGRIVEKVSGQRLDAYCSEKIFEPLGMKDTCFNPDQSLQKRFVATEIYQDRLCLGTVHDENAYFMGGVSGHAGLFSTAGDLMLFTDMLLGKGALEGKRVLSNAIISQMLRQRRPAINGTFGLGWQLNNGRNTGPFGDVFPVGSFGHTGYTGTMIWMDMPSGLCSILLTNRVHPTRDNVGILRFRRVFNNVVAGTLL